MTDDPSPAASTAASPEPADVAVDVMVIGGAGFIGSHLVERLVADGAAVDVVDDLSTGSLANLANARNTARVGGGPLRIHTIDAASPELVEVVGLRRPRQITHLASLAPGRTSPTELAASFAATLNVLEAARQASVAKIIVTLPATALYGNPASRTLPLKEGDLVARGGRGVVAKAIVELLTMARVQHDIEFTALALGSVYGPRQPAGCGVVATLMASAVRGEPGRLTGDGRQSRDFVWVDDAADAIVRAHERGSGLVVNIGTGVATTLRDLAALVSNGGPEATYVAARTDELDRFSLSPVRARIHLGWSPWTNVATGVDLLRG